MRLGPVTRKWLITIILVIGIVLAAVWLYTAYAADEVESDVAEDARVSAIAPRDLAPPPPTPRPVR